jgi:hypothetical protein
LLLGCNSSQQNIQEPGKPTLAIVNLPGSGTVSQEQFQVCKYGSSADFSYSVIDHNNGNTQTTGTFSLTDGQCRILVQSGLLGSDVTVSETAAQTGYQFDHVDLTTIQNGTVTNVPSSTNPTVSGATSGGIGTPPLQGAVAKYYNVLTPPPPPPPPPPEGGQGCTPGYWKQPQHANSYTSPYTPTMLFKDAGFDDAFPGKTLDDVLGLGGGGLNALGRHTVAALLNAASGNVSYNLTVSDVITAFNNVFPGSNSSYETLKNQFETFNTQGCPLN